MSDKLLHEKLREWANATPFRFNEAWRELGVAGNDNMLEAMADEIERSYVPVPRFDDGDPVEKGSETDYGTVEHIEVEATADSWGDWVIHLTDGTCIEGTLSQRVERADSLEKLRDDMRRTMMESPDARFMDSSWVDRLTALIERDGE